MLLLELKHDVPQREGRNDARDAKAARGADGRHLDALQEALLEDAKTRAQLTGGETLQWSSLCGWEGALPAVGLSQQLAGDCLGGSLLVGPYKLGMSALGTRVGVSNQAGFNLVALKISLMMKMESCSESAQVTNL